jgi:hypothetical protein
MTLLLTLFSDFLTGKIRDGLLFDLILYFHDTKYIEKSFIITSCVMDTDRRNYFNKLSAETRTRLKLNCSCFTGLI